MAVLPEVNIYVGLRLGLLACISICVTFSEESTSPATPANYTSVDNLTTPSPGKSDWNDTHTAPTLINPYKRNKGLLGRNLFPNKPLWTLEESSYKGRRQYSKQTDGNGGTNKWKWHEGLRRNKPRSGYRLMSGTTRLGDGIDSGFDSQSRRIHSHAGARGYHQTMGGRGAAATQLNVARHEVPSAGPTSKKLTIDRKSSQSGKVQARVSQGRAGAIRPSAARRTSKNNHKLRHTKKHSRKNVETVERKHPSHKERHKNHQQYQKKKPLHLGEFQQRETSSSQPKKTHGVGQYLRGKDIPNSSQSHSWLPADRSLISKQVDLAKKLKILADKVKQITHGNVDKATNIAATKTKSNKYQVKTRQVLPDKGTKGQPNRHDKNHSHLDNKISVTDDGRTSYSISNHDENRYMDRNFQTEMTARLGYENLPSDYDESFIRRKHRKQSPRNAKKRHSKPIDMYEDQFSKPNKGTSLGIAREGIANDDGQRHRKSTGVNNHGKETNKDNRISNSVKHKRFKRTATAREKSDGIMSNGQVYLKEDSNNFERKWEANDGSEAQRARKRKKRNTNTKERQNKASYSNKHVRHKYDKKNKLFWHGEIDLSEKGPINLPDNAVNVGTIRTQSRTSKKRTHHEKQKKGKLPDISISFPEGHYESNRGTPRKKTVVVKQKLDADNNVNAIDIDIAARRHDNQPSLGENQHPSGGSGKRKSAPSGARDSGERLRSMRVWTEWSPWSDCSATCGPGGTRTRRRYCLGVGAAGTCHGAKMVRKVCSPITECPVSGRWTAWQSWGACSASCGPGWRVRTRNCMVDSHDLKCVGAGNQMRQCTQDTCHRQGFVPSISLPVPRPQVAKLLVPVEGAWGTWSIWSACSATCGEGVEHKSRGCQEAGNGGGISADSRQLYCPRGASTIQRECVTAACNSANKERPLAAVEGAFARLHCAFDHSIPVMALQWITPGGVRLSLSNADGSGRYHMDGNYLYIKHVKEADRGTYHCLIIQPDLNTMTGDATLKVLTCAEHNPCYNGGHCTELIPTSHVPFLHFQCRCRTGFGGVYCQTNKRSQVAAIAVPLVMLLLLAIAMAVCLCLRTWNIKKQSMEIDDEIDGLFTQFRKPKKGWKRFKQKLFRKKNKVEDSAMPVYQSIDPEYNFYVKSDSEDKYASVDRLCTVEGVIPGDILDFEDASEEQDSAMESRRERKRPRRAPPGSADSVGAAGSPRSRSSAQYDRRASAPPALSRTSSGSPKKVSFSDITLGNKNDYENVHQPESGSSSYVYENVPGLQHVYQNVPHPTEPDAPFHHDSDATYETFARRDQDPTGASASTPAGSTKHWSPVRTTWRQLDQDSPANVPGEGRELLAGIGRTMRRGSHRDSTKRFVPVIGNVKVIAQELRSRGLVGASEHSSVNEDSCPSDNTNNSAVRTAERDGSAWDAWPRPPSPARRVEPPSVLTTPFPTDTPAGSLILHSDTPTGSLHGDMPTGPLHKDTPTRPIDAARQVEPLPGLTTPLQSDTPTGPLHRDTPTRPIDAARQVEPLPGLTTPLQSDTPTGPMKAALAERLLDEVDRFIETNQSIKK